MPTKPRKLKPKLDFRAPVRERDFQALELAKMLTRNHRYAVREVVNGLPVVRLVTKTKLKKLMK